MSFIWLTASWCDMIIFFILLMESIQRQLLDFTSFCLWNSVSAALLMEAIRRQLFDFVIIFSSVCLLKFSFCICKKKKKTSCQKLLRLSGGQPLCPSNKYMSRFEILCINTLSLHQYLFKFLVNHWFKFPLGCIFMIFSESFLDTQLT